jgi:catechol 2,3-dioxygenase-like lactoylglutathione lyase family enzyme
MTPAFTHCALRVSDLDKSIAFYRSYCGLEIVKEHGKGESRVVWLASPGEKENFVLVLLGGGPAQKQDEDDMTHYGFGVARREGVDRPAPGLTNVIPA